ncbi:MAG: phage head closure protein [Clostridium sp.]|nr:phage head closure protein [Clostridium sp.]MCM1400251.1 phage head closure protein [Clostridium sp.]MCM1460964.1 phage head closure protein [Bacteroides sp.]
MDDAITLVKTSKASDDIGNIVNDVAKKDVLCRVKSVDRTEFYRAGQLGMKAAYKFTLFKGDYDDEELVIYKGKPYIIYRTYEVPDTDDMELYAKVKEGVSNVKLD